MILVEFDLAGAEWVVTAYLANDPRMMEIAQSGQSPHPITGSLITGAPVELVLRESELCGSETDPNRLTDLRKPIEQELASYFVPRTMSIRQAGKKANHGLNYRMRYKRFALENEMPEADAKVITETYSQAAYPGLQNFWQYVDEELRKSRTLGNCLGRKRRFLGEWGPELQLEATAFIPQSTVFDVARTAMVRAYRSNDPVARQAALLAQVHDSVLFQYPTNVARLAAFINLITNDYMAVPLTYNGHTFTLGVDAKVGFSWGEGMRKVKLPATADELEAVISRIKAP